MQIQKIKNVFDVYCKSVCLCLLLLQMLLVDYYRAAPDLVQFSQYWCPDTTMMDKIKVREFLPGWPLKMDAQTVSVHHHMIKPLRLFVFFFRAP